jgi:hypothetical protein
MCLTALSINSFVSDRAFDGFLSFTILAATFLLLLFTMVTIISLTFSAVET